MILGPLCSASEWKSISTGRCGLSAGSRILKCSTSAVLHTWGQKLDFHPHLHCIVTGGALSPDGKEWHSPKQRKFLFPVGALAALFRGKFLAGLAQMLDAGELHLPDSEPKIPANRAPWFSLLYTKRWILYAKRPFGGPHQVLSYLANYTHRVALSNRRIVAVDAHTRPAVLPSRITNIVAIRTL